MTHHRRDGDAKQDRRGRNRKGTGATSRRAFLLGLGGLGAAGAAATLGGLLRPAHRAEAAPSPPGCIHHSGRVRIFEGDARELEPVLAQLAQDPEVQAFLDEIRPLLRDFPAGLEATAFSPPGPPPTVTLSAEDQAFIRQKVREALPAFLEARRGENPDPDPALLDELVETAVQTVRARYASPDRDPALDLFNQSRDFTAAVVGNVYSAFDNQAKSLIVLAPMIPADGGGGGGTGRPQDPKDDPKVYDDEALILLAVSFLVEILGLLASLAGLTLPNVPLGKLAGAVRGSLKSPSVREAFKKLLKVLGDARGTVAGKAEAIIDFLTVLGASGALSEIVAEVLDELSWFDYVKLGLQFAAFIASFLLPATAGARVARMVIALAAALTALVEKVKRIVKITGG
jgi:hypothetical protein